VEPFSNALVGEPDPEIVARREIATNDSKLETTVR